MLQSGLYGSSEHACFWLYATHETQTPVCRLRRTWPYHMRVWCAWLGSKGPLSLGCGLWSDHERRASD